MEKNENGKKQNLKNRVLPGAFLILITFLLYKVVPRTKIEFNLVGFLFSFDWFLFVIILMILIIFAIGTKEIWDTRRKSGTAKWKRNFLSLTALIYFYVALGLFYLLLSQPIGQNFFLLIIAPVALFDSTAYFVGWKFGKHKIVPRISPGKSWEGTIVGYMVCWIVAFLIIKTEFSYLSLLQTIALSTLIPFLAFFGDLLESWWKRKMGVKDMGTILRGHGGILDRIDSQLLVIYGVFILFWFF